MLSRGNTVPWKTLLKDFTGDDFANPKPFRDFFKPLEDWLDDFIQENNISVGWTEPDDY
ncbi:angiotensin-converting enzyme-like [Convolutriloba macropyga]|uniref:angiotensin-converting enzyme-like n=1 Tax=Convolutriloba macropyga TaxID=536237 RepID=UPI003F522565